MPAPENRSRDPLHGVTLEAIVRHLVEHHGWREMGHRIPIRCFRFDPSIQSSLTFLRRTPWARQKVEEWYLDDLHHAATGGTAWPPVTGPAPAARAGSVPPRRRRGPGGPRR